MKHKLLSREKLDMIESNMLAAKVEANEAVAAGGPYANVETKNTAWNVAYHEAMDRMCKLDGVRV